VGIQEEYQSKIFEMYYRGNDKSKGNGLGLYIVKKAVDKLRGNISFRSVEKGGTAFTVTLPFN
jgi:signal transduction histidine kinase